MHVDVICICTFVLLCAFIFIPAYVWLSLLLPAFAPVCVGRKEGKVYLCAHHHAMFKNILGSVAVSHDCTISPLISTYQTIRSRSSTIPPELSVQTGLL